MPLGERVQPRDQHPGGHRGRHLCPEPPPCPSQLSPWQVSFLPLILALVWPPTVGFPPLHPQKSPPPRLTHTCGGLPHRLCLSEATFPVGSPPTTREPPPLPTLCQAPGSGSKVLAGAALRLQASAGTSPLGAGKVCGEARKPRPRVCGGVTKEPGQRSAGPLSRPIF